MTKQSKIFAGLLAGAALGAVVALIISSDNDNVKGKVNDWFSDILDASKDKLADVGSLLKDTVAKVQEVSKDKFSEVSGRVKDAADKVNV